MLDDLAEFPLLQRVRNALAGRFGEAVLGSSFEKKELSVKIAKEALRPVLNFLKSEMKFNALNDIIGVDNLRSAREGAKRFSILYQLYQHPGGLRLRVSVDLDEGESVDSITSLYKSADWAEREIFDLFGIRFEGHPDLRRIYMPDDFDGFPLRKDFSLTGRTDGL